MPTLGWYFVDLNFLLSFGFVNINFAACQSIPSFQTLTAFQFTTNVQGNADWRENNNEEMHNGRFNGHESQVGNFLFVRVAKHCATLQSKHRNFKQNRRTKEQKRYQEIFLNIYLT